MKKLFCGMLFVMALSCFAANISMYDYYITFGDPEFEIGMNGATLGFLDDDLNALAYITDGGTVGDLYVSGSIHGNIASPMEIGGVAYTAPADDGDAGEVLVTDGAGVLSWSTSGGSGTSYLSRTGTELTTLTAGDTLRVQGASGSSATISAGTSGSIAGLVKVFNSSSAGGCEWIYAPTTDPYTTYWSIEPTYSTNTTVGSALAFRAYPEGKSTYTTSLFLGGTIYDDWRMIDGSFFNSSSAPGLFDQTSSTAKTLSIGGGTNYTLSLNAPNITSTQSSVNLLAASHVNVSGAGKTTTIKGVLNVDQSVTLDSTLGVTGNTTLGNITSLRGITTSMPSTQGLAGYQLTNDGYGSWYWAAPGGSTFWYEDGIGNLTPVLATDALYIPSGLVDIGSTLPTGSQGILSINHGDSTSTVPAYIDMESTYNTHNYMWLDDLGDLRTSPEVPTTPTDGNYAAAGAFVGSGSSTDAVDLGTAEVAGTLPASSIGNGLSDTQVFDNLTIYGGNIDNTTIGINEPLEIHSTTFTASGLATYNAGLFATAYALEPDSGTGLLMGYRDDYDFSILVSKDFATSTLKDLSIEANSITLSGAVRGEWISGNPNFSTPTGKGIMFAENSSGTLAGFPTGALIYSLDMDELPGNPMSDLYIGANTATMIADTRFYGRTSNVLVTTIAANDTSPSVKTANLFVIPGTWTSGNDIVAFDDGLLGQEITIRGGDSDCIIKDVAGIELEGDWTAATGCLICLRYWGDAWRECWRKNNN